MVKTIPCMVAREMLAEPLAHRKVIPGTGVALESVGDVGAAKRPRANEAFDVIVPASDAIEKLISGGYLVEGSRVDLVQPCLALAVK